MSDELLDQVRAEGKEAEAFEAMWAAMWACRATRFDRRDRKAPGPDSYYAGIMRMSATLQDAVHGVTRRAEQEHAEEERFDVQAEQRYRTMTGMDESRERRAERARERQRNAKSLTERPSPPK